MVLLGQTRGAIMRDDMGTFRVDVELENPARPGQRRTLKAVLVDTGAELSWVPAEVLESLGIERYNRRSEEHTSELQSQSNLVCRLLLEKKKKLVVNGAVYEE